MALNYESIKKIAAENNLSVKDLLALSPSNDPFYVGTPRPGTLPNGNAPNRCPTCNKLIPHADMFCYECDKAFMIKQLQEQGVWEIHWYTPVLTISILNNLVSDGLARHDKASPNWHPERFVWIGG